MSVLFPNMLLGATYTITEKYEPLKRVKRRAIRIPMFVWVVGFLWLITSVPIAEAQNGSIAFFPTSTLTPSVTPTATLTFTPSPTVTVTPSPSPTLLPSNTPVPNYLTFTVQYSYYDPKLGPPNCHDGNWDGMTCANTTASGEGWIGNYGKTIAMPIEWNGRIPFGSVVRVLSPPELVGEYRITDLCGACIKPDYPNLIWFDFLDDTQRLNWSSDVVVQIIIP